jgi:1-acyl-sn-glycerol-3-phosphate acyltransferase
MITALIFFPILYFLVLQEKWHKAAYKGFVLWSWAMRIFCFYPVRRIGNLPPIGEPFILVANHASYLDIFILPSILPNHPSVFLGKSEILTYPIVKAYFKNFHIPVERKNRLKAAKSLYLCDQKLKKEWSIIIFPEGGIPDEGAPKMIHFKDGAFRLAKETGVAIVPMTFQNNYRLFSEPFDWRGTAFPGVVKVVFHPVVTKEEVKVQSIVELRNHCYQVIENGWMKKF